MNLRTWWILIHSDFLKKIRLGDQVSSKRELLTRIKPSIRDGFGHRILVEGFPPSFSLSDEKYKLKPNIGSSGKQLRHHGLKGHA